MEENIVFILERKFILLLKEIIQKTRNVSYAQQNIKDYNIITGTIMI